MSILDPAIRLVGRLSFRHKMQVTALIFGAPLIIALGVIVAGLGARVAAVAEERQALAVQLPALTLLAQTHQYLATAQAWREGADQLGDVVGAQRASTQRAYAALAQALAERGLRSPGAGSDPLSAWQARLDAVAASDADRLAELHAEMRTTLRGELDRINERAGLLVDGETSTSRLLDIMSAQLPELIDSTGQAARLGAVVLVNQRVKSSRRTELTLLRGNFNALVQWSMDGLQKVARHYAESAESPEFADLAASLEDAASRLNTAYLPIQEAMTTKMLDTTDFDMTPETYLGLTAAALDQSLSVAGQLTTAADRLLAARESALQAQRNAVVGAMLLLLVVVVAAFVAAYISIMRGLNGLSAAVKTMAAGDLSARVEVSTRDEIGLVGSQFNRMVESLAQRTALLREKTNDIQNLLHHMPQGILTIVTGGTIHAEYSDYLETIFETDAVRGRRAIDFLFAGSELGADALAQVDAAIAACLGEDRMNFDFNSHLLAGELCKTMADGRVKQLELSWSPICDENGTVDKLMVCVRDVSELRLLEAEAEQQKRELQMIGQLLAISQEKFAEFASGARRFIAQNESLLQSAAGATATAELAAQLFRNMHTIKGNARTYGLLQLTDVVHCAEQAYDELRQGGVLDRDQLLGQLREVAASLDEYTALNDDKLGRKGGGQRSAENYVRVERGAVDRLLADLNRIAGQSTLPAQLAPALREFGLGLQKLGCETLETILDGVFASLPSLASELAKEPPRLTVSDHGIVLRNEIADTLRNVFMHLYRNSLDHGIEEVGERLLVGKPASGSIALELTLSGEQLLLRLQDDGRGLALARIRQRAVDRGLLTADDAMKVESDESIAQLIFAAGFSTASAVSAVSGRGVGMDAVRNFVRREGGEISIVFCDENVGADFRAFATLIALPAKFAVATGEIAVPTLGSPAPTHLHEHERRDQHEGRGELCAIVGGLLAPGQLAAV